MFNPVEFTSQFITYQIRDWTRDGAVCRYRSENHGYWKYVFFQNSTMKQCHNITPPSVETPIKNEDLPDIYCPKCEDKHRHNEDCSNAFDRLHA